jgi:hypothetical protein
LNFGRAQDNITIVAPTSKAAEGLDLQAVAELFKEAKNLEEFEKSLNDYELGINNLDLDEDGYVDYIRVVEDISDYTHLIILQVPLGEDEFQDVATIEIEKSSENECNMQVHGNEVFYGYGYYVAPTYVHIHTWPIIALIYGPVYRPYRSVFYFGYYPHYWRPYRPVTYHVYHTRTVHYTQRRTFEIRKESRVITVQKINYKPRNSTLAKREVKVIEPRREPRKTEDINRNRQNAQPAPGNDRSIEKPTQNYNRKTDASKAEQKLRTKNEIKNPNHNHSAQTEARRASQAAKSRTEVNKPKNNTNASKSGSAVNKSVKTTGTNKSSNNISINKNLSSKPVKTQPAKNSSAQNASKKVTKQK